jgi:ubiquinone/menaquinone biosynthesis C-methylase UbiE
MQPQSTMPAVASQPDFAEMFERLVVPHLFTPWGNDLLERARPIGPSDRVLDLGCGTGIVARLLRERLGGAARIVGLDINPGMLAVARRIAPELDWQQGDAAALPFGDRSFDVVLSQQMLQFVPDKVAAAREMRRVLAPGGRVLASTWRAVDEQPFLAALTRVAERHLGPSRDTRMSFGDGEALRVLLVEAGFVDVRVEVVTRVDPAPDALVRPNVMAMGFDLAALSAEERELRLAAIELEIAPVVARYRDDRGFAAPMRANLVTATTPAA